MKPPHIKKNRRASKVWDYYLALLDQAGKWKPEYEAMFAVLVDAIAGFLDISETLTNPNTPPILINPHKGTAYRNPLLDLKANHINTIKTYGTAFGLSPLADMNLKSTPAQALQGLLDFMKGPDAANG